MHRVRHLAWELPQLGWDCEVLAPNSSFQRSDVIDPESASLFNPVIPFNAAVPKSTWFYRLLKIRSIGWMALSSMHEAGCALMAQKQFDLIYFSTANFPLFSLGPRWFQRFGVPYVLDYHDPWVTESIDYRTTKHPIKRWVNAKLAILLERGAIAAASGVVSVSAAYLTDLRRRYGSLASLAPERTRVIPFSANPADFPANPVPIDSLKDEIAYIGAGGPIMVRSFSTICHALRLVRNENPELVDGIRLKLFGTQSDWRPGDSKLLESIAHTSGIGDLVVEHPHRIGYRLANQILAESAGVMVLGVDDPTYMPSKLFTFALSGRPLLGCFHSGSPPAQCLQRDPGLGHLIQFNRSNPAVEKSSGNEQVMRNFLTNVRKRVRVDRTDLLKPHLSGAMAKEHAQLFDAIAGMGAVRTS